LTTAPPVVVDTSAAIAIIREEAAGVAAARIIRTAELAGTRVVVPSHFWLEVLNPLLTRYRARGLDVIQAIHELDRLGFETIEIDRPLVLSTLDLAERHGLTAYDAMYLALAISLDGRLLTFDEQLRLASGARAIAIDGGHGTAETAAPYEHDVTWPRYKEAAAYLAQLRADSIAGPRSS
jgi:predicted nucleic acid-binding protein